MIMDGEVDEYPEAAFNLCLLYTSDAADERSSVDLGGRRIIKKKNHVDISVRGYLQKNTRLNIIHNDRIAQT